MNAVVNIRPTVEGGHLRTFWVDRYPNGFVVSDKEAGVSIAMTWDGLELKAAIIGPGSPLPIHLLKVNPEPWSFPAKEANQ